MLSFLPPNLERLKFANFGASVFEKFPSRFGMLATLPTDNPDPCFDEIKRSTTTFSIKPDGFATTTVHNGVALADPRLNKPCLGWARYSGGSGAHTPKRCGSTTDRLGNAVG